jgi:hypothetical protein
MNFFEECRFCGCTNENACVNTLTGQTCYWVAEGICSACVPPEYVGAVELCEMAAAAHELAEELPNFALSEHAEAARLYMAATKGAGA